MTRREFLRFGIFSYFSFSSGLGFPFYKRSRLVRIDFGAERNFDSYVKGLSYSIRLLTGARTEKEAVYRIFKKGERIAIKVNPLGGRFLTTDPELVYAFVELLVRNGIDKNNIIIWDRSSWELRRAGFVIKKRKGPLCYGTDYTGYDDRLVISGSVGSLFSRIIKEADAVVNFPVLKDHDLMGVSLSLKNHYGSIHNPNKYHDYTGVPYIPDLNLAPYIKNKQRLVILDALKGQYNGGPSAKPRYQWNEGAVLMSYDPVSIDYYGYILIDKVRRKNGLKTLKAAGRDPLGYIRLSEKKGLGTTHFKLLKV